MKTKYISFNKEMLSAVRENRKTVTRRIIKKVPPGAESIERHSSSANCGLFVTSPNGIFIKCSYTIGTILTVREDNDLLLRVTSVSAERVQDITIQGVINEGCAIPMVSSVVKFEDDFINVWNDCYNTDGRRWSDNPFVWVVEFQRIK